VKLKLTPIMPLCENMCFTGAERL